MSEFRSVHVKNAINALRVSLLLRWCRGSADKQVPTDDAI